MQYSNTFVKDLVSAFDKMTFSQCVSWSWINNWYAMPVNKAFSLARHNSYLWGQDHILVWVQFAIWCVWVWNILQVCKWSVGPQLYLLSHYLVLRQEWGCLVWIDANLFFWGRRKTNCLGYHHHFKRAVIMNCRSNLIFSLALAFIPRYFFLKYHVFRMELLSWTRLRL